jgi:L-fuculose-phosphate aldolase
MSADVDRLRERMTRVAHKLFLSGLIRSSEGNISCRITPTGNILIKPSGFEMGDLSPADFIVIDQRGHVIEGENRPSIETPMHLSIYKSRKDVGGVVHTHSTFASAFASSGVELLPIGITNLSILRGVPIAPYRLPGSRQLAIEVAKTLADKAAVLLENHGVLAVGRDIESAYRVASAVEESARLQLFSSLVGKPRRFSVREIQELLELGKI